MTITTRTGVKFQTTSESRQLGTGDNNQPHITLGWQIHVENQVTFVHRKRGCRRGMEMMAVENGLDSRATKIRFSYAMVQGCEHKRTWRIENVGSIAKVLSSYIPPSSR
jgi:hypothetical protein